MSQSFQQILESYMPASKQVVSTVQPTQADPVLVRAAFETRLIINNRGTYHDNINSNHHDSLFEQSGSI